MRVGLAYVNYNSSRFVIESLRSLDRSMFDAIVVVDNCSPKDDVAIICSTYPEVHLLQLRENVGFGEGCNAGARWLIDERGVDVVFFLNPDTRVDPRAVAEMLKGFEDPCVGVVAPRITTDETRPRIWYGGGEMKWWKGSVSIDHFGELDESVSMHARDVGFASGCAFMVTRAVYLEVGGFHPAYFMYEEDVEFSLAVLQAGKRIRLIPSAVVRHVGQGSILGDEQEETRKVRGILNPRNPKLPFYVRLLSRNRWLTVRRHGGVRGFAIYAFAGSAWWMLKLFRFLMAGRLDAVRAALKGSMEGLLYRF
ncbi:glycosyl transferase 21 family protein [Methyloversatilis sp. RAC08]|nr:glycosyl transferase 21 family protein [Methyloversatilis sp. RAC08]